MSDKDFALSRLKQLQQEINDYMVEYFESKEALLAVDLTDHGKLAFERLREFTTRPGKRVRGALAIVAYEMFGGKNHKTAMELAIAIELIQNYLLIVDDVMDRSVTRRGGSTIHTAYTKEFENSHQHEDAVHLGNMLGVNVGLIAQHMASDIMARLDEKPENVIATMSIFHQNVAATGYGQIEDLFGDALKVVNEESIETVQRLKSSYYTFVNPLQSGARLAGADETTLEELKNFGIPAGIAFQLQDDVIGLFGDEKSSGKSSIEDLKEGKITLLIHEALTKGSEEQVKEVKQALGNENVTEKQHQRVKEIVESVGGLKYSQEKAQANVDAAREIIQNSNWPEDGKRFIDGLIDYVIERDR